MRFMGLSWFWSPDPLPGFQNVREVASRNLAAFSGELSSGYFGKPGSRFFVFRL
jgi:hypothetical protein